jgi:hypothetical protein
VIVPNLHTKTPIHCNTPLMDKILVKVLVRNPILGTTVLTYVKASLDKPFGTSRKLHGVLYQ